MISCTSVYVSTYFPVLPIRCAGKEVMGKYISEVRRNEEMYSDVLAGQGFVALK